MKHFSGDPVAHYLRDIADKPALKRGQELALFARIAKGDAEAYRQVVESHLKMVVFIARHHRSALPLADRIEEGNLGMMHAVQKFDPSYGCRFATYAVWWVRSYIERAIANQSYIIRVPVHIRQQLHAVHDAESVLSVVYHRLPTIAEIAAHLETRVSHVESLLYVAQPQIQVEEMTQLDDLAESIAGLADTPERRLQDKQRSATVSRWLEALKPREKQVICFRFGLQECSEMTLEAIGEELGCTKERVRQIQVAALQKLRRSIADEP